MHETEHMSALLANTSLLLNQADAVVTDGGVGGGADIQVIRGRTGGVGDKEKIAEFVREAAARSSRRQLERIGLAHSGHPGDAERISFLSDAEDAED